MNPMVQFLKQLTDRVSPSAYTSMNQSDAKTIAYIRQLQREMKKEDVLEIPFEDLNVTIFDLETTGFYPSRGDKILSVGAVKVNGACISEEKPFYSLIYGEEQPPETIVELTGISKDMLQHAPLIGNVLEDFFHYIQRDTLVAHHAGHERNFMQYYCKAVLKTGFEHRIVDTTFLTKIVEPTQSLITLDDCCSYYGIDIKKRHHALYDAMATAELWVESVKKIQSLGFKHLRDVYSHLAKNK
ncbi:MULTISPECIES: exonuclease domain-containing protein [Bacillaceae]|uniref:3'-5' exonuclease n=1 Tax=Evansella alkalicola TaxID=745819 RepID=A0ABS6JU20_9BACI|nr:MULTISPECIES: exonuclease domain-containing protein [Bacillaceae]MBU9722059.1 3'-5' exonuclease [Bacillus alkalicola]